MVFRSFSFSALPGLFIVGLLNHALFGVEVKLPVPTGPFAVGRVDYHWSDDARPEPLSKRPGAHRELMLSVWYPAGRSVSRAPTASYLVDFKAIQSVVSERDIKELFRPADSAIRESGFPKTHAIENASMPASPTRYPVLVFSHGLGLIRAVYTAELEDLASHGYVVAAIDHTYDTAFTAFPGGRFVLYAQETWDRESKKPGGFLNFVKERVEVWALDTRFLIDQLARYDRTPSLGAPFAEHLDLRRLGAFGHSVGGLASVRACQIDQRIRACMNQDSDIFGSPFIVDGTLGQPLLFFIATTADVSSEQKVHPTDAQLASLKMTRSEYDSQIRQAQKNQIDALSGVRGGSYRVTLSGLPGVTHRIFSDLPLIAAAGDLSKEAESFHNFNLAESYVRAFFDKTLKGDGKTLLEAGANPPDPLVRVDRYGPAVK